MIDHLTTDRKAMNVILSDQSAPSPALAAGTTTVEPNQSSAEIMSASGHEDVEAASLPVLPGEIEGYFGRQDPTHAVRQAARRQEIHAMFVAHRSKPDNAEQTDIAAVLHVGCGFFAREKLPPLFRRPGWQEIRLDIDPEVQPDFVASLTDMHVIPDSAVDAVYSSHNVEHLYPHDVVPALREMRRVLKPDGFAFIKLPDLQEVARYVAEGKLEDPLYLSPVGPIAPLDILYGHRPSLAGGNLFMAHRTGFTAETLGAALIKAGFVAVLLQRDPSQFSLDAIAWRIMPDAERLAAAQARILPAPDRSAVLYSLTT
jgi:SAM-dependent methyltransferase